MSGGFFRGTSADQDTRFSNKQQKLLKSQKFAPELEHLVDMTRVKMDVIKPWIATRVTELLGFEDEVLINFIYSLLDGKEVNGKEVQISLTGFMEKNTVKFMKELWTLLLSAQKNESGVPQQFLDAKEEELRKKKEEMDRITNEIQKKKEKENRELECERSKKMDGGVETKVKGDTKEPVPKHMLPEPSPEDARGAENRNGRRDRSSGSSPQNSKSASNSRSYSGGRHRLRSISSSPEARGQSISPRRPRKQSITPRRRHSPQISRSPPGRSSYSRRRSRSLPRRVSLSPVRRRVRSPYRRRSPSPFRRYRSPSPFRRHRSPSPIRGRRSPVRRRSPLHRHRSPSPFRRRYRRSPSTPSHGSPAPVRRSSPHPAQRRSPAPLHNRSRSSDRSTSPSADRHRSLLGRSPQDNRRLAPTSRRRSPSPYGSHSPSPVQKRSYSPVRRGSSREHRRSPLLPSHRRSPSPYQSSSPSPARHMSLLPVRRSSKEHRRSPTPPVQSPRGRVWRDHEDQKDLRDRKPALSSVLERSPIGRNRSPREDKRSSSPFESPLRQRGAPIAHDGCLSPPQKQSLHSYSTDKQKDSPKKAYPKDQYSPEAGHRSTESRIRLCNADLRNKGLDRKSEKSSEQGVNPETWDGTKSSMSYKETVLRERQQALYKRDGTKTDERSSSHLSNVKESDARRESETSPVLTRKVDHYNGSSMHDSGSEESDKRRTENKVKRKHRRPHRHEETSDDDSSDDSENEDRKEAKRRRKEEKRLRKEEKRRRRKERRHKKEEKRAEKFKLRNRNDIGSDEDEGRRESHTTDNEDAQSEQKKLEIELRNKALESLKAKKGINN